MWASLGVGEPVQSLDMGNDVLSIIASSLTSHPLVDSNIAKSIASQTVIIKEDDIPQVTYAPFCPTGDSWFESSLGKSASNVIKELRKARRVMKDSKGDIDKMITAVRNLKALETEATLAKLDWASSYEDTIRSIGLDDKSLKSLRLFGNSRENSLIRACNTWENAESTLKTLDEFQDVWGDEERQSWVNAMQMRKDARKMWKNTLNQFDNLNKEQQKWLNMAKAEIEEHGSINARGITENLIHKGVPRLNVNRIAKLLKMYGEEINIIKAPRKGEYMTLNRTGLIIKDPWAYAAGFLDADGYITITERGEPRAGFIATGDRGRMHCEQLHKNIGAGKLQLDQKVYKDGQRSQHRVSFYSKDDLTKLLKKITPHLRMKDMQAKAVAAFINEKDPMRKTELKRFVQFSNREGTRKAEESLKDWGVDKDTVMSWSEGL
tara:strand:+ start:1957 stop:3264 length:1308 start_codon:yes stop_codon:yes gene_type:complete